MVVVSFLPLLRQERALMLRGEARKINHRLNSILVQQVGELYGHIKQAVRRVNQANR